MSTAARERIAQILIVLLAAAVFLADVYLFRRAILPGPPYFVPILLAAYFLPTRQAVGVAVFGLLTRGLADWLQGTPLWLLTLYATANVLVSYLSINLAAGRRREAALARERGQLVDELAAAGAELQRRAERPRLQRRGCSSNRNAGGLR